MRKGFTLIELMIVVAIIAIIAAIAIPSLLRSRIAANQTAAAAACKAIAEAEEIYHRTDYDKNGVLEYSQNMKGANSLLETTAGASDLNLIDRALAAAEGAPGTAVPKAGYVFSILTSQGTAAGQARSFIVAGSMTLGYGASAVPAAYDSTGRDTFIISNSGVIFQCDRGATNTGHPASYDPTPGTWVPTE